MNFYHIMRQDKLVDQLQKDDPVTVLITWLNNACFISAPPDVTMSHGEGNAFINIGKFLERAIQSADILDIKFSDLDYSSDKPADTDVLESHADVHFGLWALFKTLPAVLRG